MSVSTDSAVSDRNWKLRAGDSLLLAVCAGLVAGAAQVVIVLIRRELLHEFTFTSRDVIWMAPLSQLIMVTPLAMFVALLSRVVPGRTAVVITAWLCAAYASYATTALFLRLYPLAILLLSVGIATRVSAMFRSEPRRWVTRARRATFVLAALIAVAALSSRGIRAFTEWRAMASLPDAPDEAPNVLLLILDTVRASSMDLYGYERATAPGMARLAREGAVADWAMASSSWTLPSHGSMFTGRRPDELNARLLTPLDDTHRTLAEVLRDRGYATGGFVANPYYTQHETGLGRGFIRFSDYRVSFREMALTGSVSRLKSFQDAWASVFYDNGDVIPALRRREFTTTSLYPLVDRKNVTQVAGDFIRWQSGLGGRPFFAFLNIYDAHADYQPPRSMLSRFSENPTAQDRYDGCIAFIDQEVTALLDTLEKRGILDRTIVVITSDHGEQFGEHGLTQHANSLYLPVLHVPLIVRYPAKVPGGVRIAPALSLQDLPATILDLAGSQSSSVGGSSFAPLLSGAGGVALSPVISELEEHRNVLGSLNTPELRSLMNDSLHYIVDANGAEQLYAYRTDRGEANNLARDSSHAAALSSMRQELRRSSGSAPYRLRPP